MIYDNLNVNPLYIGEFTMPQEVEYDFGYSTAGSITTRNFIDFFLLEAYLDNIKARGLFMEVDNVNHPPHYQSKNGLEVIDIINDFELNYPLGNVVKYILRHSKKGGIEDLKKAVWYLNYEIEQRESTENDHPTDMLPLQGKEIL